MTASNPVSPACLLCYFHPLMVDLVVGSVFEIRFLTAPASHRSQDEQGVHDAGGKTNQLSRELGSRSWGAPDGTMISFACPIWQMHVGDSGEAVRKHALIRQRGQQHADRVEFSASCSGADRMLQTEGKVVAHSRTRRG